MTTPTGGAGPTHPGPSHPPAPRPKPPTPRPKSPARQVSHRSVAAAVGFEHTPGGPAFLLPQPPAFQAGSARMPGARWAP